VPWWLLARRAEERRRLEEARRRAEEERRRQELEEAVHLWAEEEERRLAAEGRRLREEWESEVRANLREVLVGSRFAPLVHGMLRWLSVLPGDVVRVSELAMKTTNWLQRALNNPGARANAVMLGAYAHYLKVVKEKEYRRARHLVAYRVDKERVRCMLRLLEDDVEMGALCWTGRAIHNWVRDVCASRRGGDDVQGMLGRMGVHYVHVWIPRKLYWAVAPPRVMLSQAWDVRVPWVVVDAAGGRKAMQGVIVVPPV